MATRIAVQFGHEKNAGATKCFDVEESADDVLEHLIPIQPPSSTLEARQNIQYKKADGSGRVFLQPQFVAWVEENAEADA